MAATTTGTTRRRRLMPVFVLVVALLIPGAVGACSGHAPDPQPMASHTTMTPMADARAAAWASRPAYTTITAAGEEAYRWALHHPDVLQWIPCMCGCGGLGHRSNLDCYFQRRTDGAIAFEEHASYCTICIDITLRAAQLDASGASLVDIRTTIDIEFGDYPGTDTPWPPS